MNYTNEWTRAGHVRLDQRHGWHLEQPMKREIQISQDKAQNSFIICFVVGLGC